MAHIVADRLRETMSDTGTGALDLDGLVTGFQALDSPAATNDTIDLFIYNSTDAAWETGRYTFTSGSPDTITLSQLWASSTGSAITWGAGIKDVVGGIPASIFKSLPAYGGNYALINGKFAVSAAAGALTVALKTTAGNDPSPSDPVFAIFPTSDGTNGPIVLAIVAATSIVVSSGSTLGVTSSTAFYLWVVGFNDAGTFRLGIINCSTWVSATSAQIYALVEGNTSSTAEGGAGAADSAGVIYTGTAVSTKLMRIVGRLEWNSSGVTAGTWTTTNMASVPWQLFGPGMHKPGETVQEIYMESSAGFSTASTSYVATNASVTITPKSAANLIKASTAGALYDQGGSAVGALLTIRRGTSTDIGVTTEAFASAGEALAGITVDAYDKPNTVSATTYAAYIKKQSATGTAQYPVAGGGRNVNMRAQEIQG